MKTGGTLNFLKRAGAILMLVAVFASSCNKYADDFKQLNTKLDGLATSVGGLSALTADLASVKASVASALTAIAALPNAATHTAMQTSLTAVAASITTIQTNLAALTTTVNGLPKLADVNAIATKVAADLTIQLAKTQKAITDAMTTNNTTLTSSFSAAIAANNAILDALVKADLVANNAKIADAIAANNAAISKAIADNNAAISAAIVANNPAITAAEAAAMVANNAAIVAAIVANNPAIDALIKANDAAISAAIVGNNTAIATLIQTQIDALQAAIKGGSTDTVTSVTVTGLQLLLNAQKLVVDQILLNQVTPLIAVTINNTTPQVGSVLTALPVTALGATTLATYQWYQGSTAIAGATNKTYYVLPADLGLTIKVKATGTGNALSTEQSSASTSVVTPTTSVTAATFTYGTAPNPGVAQVGGMLTILAANIAPSGATVTYQWQSCTTASGTFTNIATSATSSKYYPVAADATMFIRCAVTGSGAYSGTVYTQVSAAVIYPTALTGIAASAGTPQVGVSYAAGAISPYAQPTSTGSSSQTSLGNPTIATYQWQSSADAGTTWVDISGATTATYTPAPADLGVILRVKAIGKSFCYGTVVSAASVAVVYPQAITAMAAPTTTGTLAWGNTLTVGATTPTTIVGTGATYQWQSSTVSGGPYTDVFGATGSTYLLLPGDVGKYFAVYVTGQNGYFGSVTSAQTAIIAMANVTSSAYAWATGNNTVTITLTGGAFKTTAISASDFTFGGANAASFATGVFTRVNGTTVIVTGLTMTSASTDNTILVKAATVTSQPTAVTASIASVIDVTSAAWSFVAANNTLNITLVGGTFKGSATSSSAASTELAASDFIFTGTDAAAIALGTIYRISSTNVRIVLAAPTVPAGLTGVNNVVTVKAATQATQATTVAGVASTL